MEPSNNLDLDQVTPKEPQKDEKKAILKIDGK